MAGYKGFAMSNNAVTAYGEGLLPASKIKGVPAALVAQFVHSREWHHSSKKFNRVEFYDQIQVRAVFGLEPSEDYKTNPQAVAALAAHKAQAKDAGTVSTGCTVRWLEWGGTVRHPKAIERTAQGCSVHVKGSTATVTLPGGAVLVKRLTTRGFSFEKTAA